MYSRSNTLARAARKQKTCRACRRCRSISTLSTEEITRSRLYCLNLLRGQDTPSSLLLPYLPASSRDAYLALRAFNIEVARTADTTSTPTIGTMRLQFHREAVTKALAGQPPKQPVSILLAKAAEDVAENTGGRGKWSKSWFMRVIDTREKYLSNPPYTSMAALESYAENTYSTLLYLTLQSLPMASLTADHVASHIGKATGIAAVLRGFPLLAFPGPPPKHNNQNQFGGDVGGSRQGAVTLPLDIMAKAGVREEDVLRNGSNAKGLRDAVFAVATRANDHLITARQLLQQVRAGEVEDHEFEHRDEEEHLYLPIVVGPAGKGGLRRFQSEVEGDGLALAVEGVLGLAEEEDMRGARVFHDATSDVRVNRWRETLGLLTSKMPSSPTDF
ncbi:hypothetical protein LTR91_020106 [Friedmanniomyces endolithicus]|uniref:Uncharacterized protein n=1 Tax=Friedmanniomyces endolithicus TaxID=329885 RepID=A0AAN6HCQ2_9PEZI|nr:hypothetical protein LTR94_021689 [Friedmanniomyces endolithicus]KAK0769077.1 hypothetical protein LTR59_017237 [Friedmanniomyces endolithicus]KAK0771693.1 hypothetical protein LTR38_017136 [Friedmanniomyces endolithicus]KAK0816809.1 hypothetical protein LTR75_003492 [Friedmanniomyces endolithicus]KAK0854175.1 hypothetical protein LTR03_002546 [Friedmanniomyces endolithicus]